MKMAVEFDLAVLDSKHKNYMGQEDRWEVEDLDHVVISEVNWLYDSMDFDCDVLEPFLDSDEFKKLEPSHDYHIFQYGDVSGETSYIEYGTEFDGWIFEPEVTKIQDLGKAKNE